MGVMNHGRRGLLSIGNFATAAQLTLKALRLYDQLGILTPSYVDPESSYRYYHNDQLTRARLVRMMREADMPLATIRQVLAAAPADAETLVREYWLATEARFEQARVRVHELIANLRQEVPTMAFEVEVRTVAPQPILSITSRVKVERISEQIGDNLRRLYAAVKAQGGRTAGPPFGLYHGPINHDDDGPIEVCVPVERPLTGSGDLVARELPGAQLASVRLHRDQCMFPAILQGYDAACDWVRANGFELADSPREIWHTGEGDDLDFEIAWPFRG